LLTLVPTPIGNIGDITLRAMEALGSADILLCEDTRITKKLLTLLKERYNLTCKEEQKFISLHSHNEKSFIANLTPAFFDKNIVYASDAGMPGISDPGALLVSYCIQEGITYDVLPGANAVLTAFSASGFETTAFVFFGFLPHKGGQRQKALQEALFNGYTTILYEAPHRLEKLLEELRAEIPDREVFLAKELTKKFQTYLKATPAKLLEQLAGNFKGEWVVIIQAGALHRTTLSEKDVLSLELPIKTASKLIAKITGENPKSCYQRLLINKK
jgi:16S rRNA (cytidine1402-2'-O)-methyltransferase